MSRINSNTLQVGYSFYFSQNPFSTCVWSFHITTELLCLYLLYLARLLTVMLQEQGYVAIRLKSLLQKFNGRHHELEDCYGVSICTMKTDLVK